MKVALVILRVDPARGGAERYTTDLARDLAKRSAKVMLLAQDLHGLPEGVEAVELASGSSTRLGRYGDFLSALEDHLRTIRYDIVHAMLPVRRCDLYHPHAGVAAEAVRSGHLKHAHPVRRRLAQAANRVNLKRRSFVQTERKLLGGDDPPVVLCLSNYVKGEVRRHYPLPDEKLVRLFNAVDLGRFDPDRVADQRPVIRRRWGFGEDSIVLLMIAQDFARKGLKEAIGALARVEDRRLVLVVAGRGDVGTYRSLAAGLGIEDRVHFAGVTDEAPAFYAAADGFILPTRHDPCSLVVLEALAMGLPVISTKYNGACEIMESGRQGFVLDDPGDLEVLAGAINRLGDGRLRQVMAGECLALRPMLSQDQHVDRLLSIYRQVMDRRG